MNATCLSIQSVTCSYYAGLSESEGRSKSCQNSPKTSCSHGQTVPENVDKEDMALQREICGTIKKSLLYSQCGTALRWTQNFPPGDLPFYALLVAFFCSFFASAMVVFGTKLAAQVWFIILLTFFVFSALTCLAFITAFNQDELTTFKVCNSFLLACYKLNANPQTYLGEMKRLRFCSSCKQV